MASLEMFNLKWNDFQDKVSIELGSMKDNQYFTDVTLVSEDSQKLEVHKMILSAASPWFMNLLLKEKYPHSIMYMRGLKFKDLLAIIDFIYHGEVKIVQDQLKDFLSLAEELQLKGLVPSNDSDQESNKTVTEPLVKIKDQQESLKAELETKIEVFDNTNETALEELLPNNDLVTTEDLMDYSINGADKISFTTNIAELDEKINSLALRAEDGLWSCSCCGKTFKQKRDLSRHIESLHIEGVEHPCSNCGKIFRSRLNVQRHLRLGC